MTRLLKLQQINQAKPRSISIIEVIDTTDDERYFPLGYFSSVEIANQAIDQHVSERDGCPPHSDWTEPEEGVVLELRRLDTGWTTPVFLMRREWSHVYIEADDKFVWSELK